MPFVLPLIFLAVTWPYLMASFFEWSFDPSLWGWYTRAILAVVYAGFGGFLMGVLLKLAKSYYGIVNRKRGGGSQG